MLDYNYMKTLGKVVRDARQKMRLTQAAAAEAANVDVRTILNIENGHGNPKMEILCKLVHTLQLNPQEIFYPDMQPDSPYLQKAHMLLSCMTEEDIKDILPILTSLDDILQKKHK